MGSVSIYTDGACRGNPDGPGGYGVLLRYIENNGTVHEKELSQGFIKTTNNRMELMAAVAGLEALTRPCLVDLYSDSKYLVDAFNQGWLRNWVKNDWSRKRSGPVKNIDLWKRLLNATKGHKINFIWVKGHDKNPDNELCDKLAVKAALSSNLIEDDGV